MDPDTLICRCVTDGIADQIEYRTVQFQTVNR